MTLKNQIPLPPLEHDYSSGDNCLNCGGKNPNKLKGDINGDTTVDISDALALFMHSMLPNQYPITYSGNIDFNHDGSVDISDALLLFMYSMLPNKYPID